MQISGLQKLTLLDFPGQVACIVFTGGCNFNCSFCHNPDLVHNTVPSVEDSELFSFLEKRGKLLDGVVITGGEPTLHSSLPELISRIKSKGYLVKLDTNGTNPSMLKILFSEGLVDYVAMDIKGPFEDYSKIACREVEVVPIKESIELIIKSGIDHEFRTTVVPGLHNVSKVGLMASSIAGARKYFLQVFKKETELLDPSFKEIKGFTKEELDSMLSKAKEFVSADLRV
jgi:pyruvate formate lyase activating enzyme